MTNVLYISYDGLTDPLGQSQVLPYLVGLTQTGNYHFTVLSCEKPQRLAAQGEQMKQQLKGANIDWQPLLFHSKPPFVAKWWDLRQLHRTAARLHRQHHFSLIHCRSYVAAMVGEGLKQRFGVPWLFDMRGFWVDERVEGGMWNLRNPFYKLAYWYYKRRETQLIGSANGIISLTETGKQEVQTWKSYQQHPVPLSVISCSTDFEFFTVPAEAQRQAARKTFSIEPDALTITYLGSIGTWYLLDEMLGFFAVLKQSYPAARFLFITQEPAKS